MSRMINIEALFLLVLVAASSSVHGLMCYSCLHNKAQINDACVNNATRVDVTTCPSNQKYCMVEEFVIPNMGKFERMCASGCRPECTAANGHKRCITCCQQDLCNGGDSAMERLLRLTVPLMLTSSALRLVIG